MVCVVGVTLQCGAGGGGGGGVGGGANPLTALLGGGGAGGRGRNGYVTGVWIAEINDTLGSPLRCGYYEECKMRVFLSCVWAMGRQ